MNEVLIPGLTLTILGMGLVFLALGALWLMMWALEWAFRTKEAQPVAERQAPFETTSPTDVEVAAIVGALFQAGLIPGAQPAIGGKLLGQALGHAGAWRVARQSIMRRRMRR